MLESFIYKLPPQFNWPEGVDAHTNKADKDKATTKRRKKNKTAKASRRRNRK